MKKTIISLLTGILVLSILMVFQPPITEFLFNALTEDEYLIEGSYMEQILGGAWMGGSIDPKEAVDKAKSFFDNENLQDSDTLQMIHIVIYFVVPILIFILTSITLIIVFRKIKT